MNLPLKIHWQQSEKSKSDRCKSFFENLDKLFMISDSNTKDEIMFTLTVLSEVKP